jgi:hypothetical protein
MSNVCCPEYVRYDPFGLLPVHATQMLQQPWPALRRCQAYVPFSL